MRWAFVIVVSACAARPLAPPSPMVEVDAAGPMPAVCTTHAVNELVSEASGINLAGIAVDGDNIYYSRDSSAIWSVPSAGGSAHKLTDGYTQLVTTFDHHVFFAEECWDGNDPTCPPAPDVVDFDLSSGTEQRYTVPVPELQVIANAQTIVAASGTDVVLIDRATNEVTEIASTADAFDTVGLVQLGTHAFALGSDGLIRSIDLSSGALDVLSASAITAIATDGQSLLAADQVTMMFYDESGTPLTYVAHDGGVVATAVVDATNVYWSNLEDASLHITPRIAATSDCLVPLHADGVVTLAEDAGSVYAVIERGSGWPLLRITK